MRSLFSDSEPVERAQDGSDMTRRRSFNDVQYDQESSGSHKME